MKIDIIYIFSKTDKTHLEIELLTKASKRPVLLISTFDSEQLKETIQKFERAFLGLLTAPIQDARFFQLKAWLNSVEDIICNFEVQNVSIFGMPPVPDYTEQGLLTKGMGDFNKYSDSDITIASISYPSVVAIIINYLITEFDENYRINWFRLGDQELSPAHFIANGLIITEHSKSEFPFTSYWFQKELNAVKNSTNYYNQIANKQIDSTVYKEAISEANVFIVNGECRIEDLLYCISKGTLPLYLTTDYRQRFAPQDKDLVKIIDKYLHCNDPDFSDRQVEYIVNNHTNIFSKVRFSLFVEALAMRSTYFNFIEKYIN